MKNTWSDTSERLRSLPLLLPGGGVTTTSRPSVGPLEIVTGALPRTKLANPRPGFAPFARRSADANSSSKSVMEPLRLREFPLVGCIARESPG